MFNLQKLPVRESSKQKVKGKKWHSMCLNLNDLIPD